MANQQQDPKRVSTGVCRLSYCFLTKKRPAREPGEKEKYSVTILIPKSDMATKQRIDAAFTAAVQEGVTGKWGGVRPPQIANPVYDGDGLRPQGEPFPAECKGHWVLTASTENKPEIVDVAMNYILDPTQIYSGMFARVSVRFFAYLKNGKKGIGAGLGNVMKMADGEPLSGRTDAASDFGEPLPLPGDFNQPYAAPAPQYQAPQYPQPMQQGFPQGQGGYGQPYGTPTPAPAPQYQAIDPITGKPVIGGVMGI
jgi:hypothetical protein